MSDADRETVETVDGEEAEILLADPDDYHQSQRLREIHTRRQAVNKALDNIDRYTTDNEHSKQMMALADAVCAYVGELEPLIERTEHSPELPDGLPWDSVTHYADVMGHDPETQETPAYNIHLSVHRTCNKYLAKVKPLIEADDADEWEL